ncbi:hypothetical protein C0995_001310 [Termitomyces sp. Mi166|nr:hypothetical protein C0995_001310 [Termitomyces sp. Mi166\
MKETLAENKAYWVTVEQLRNILEQVYYNGPRKFLGSYFPRSFKKAIPDLVEQGYIRWHADKMKFRVSKQMAVLCMQAASQTPGEEVDRHSALADYFLQKMSFTRPTYAMVVEEVKELREENNELKGRLGGANPSDHFLHESSVATFTSDKICDMNDKPVGQEVEMADSEDTALGPFHPTSESTIISTPIKPTRMSGPEGFYPTPQSLPHACAGACPSPLSPSLGRASFSSRSNPVDDIDVDEEPVAGASGSAFSAPSRESNATSSVPDPDADIVYLANVINAPKLTVQSIEETYHTQIAEFEKELRELREFREMMLRLISAFDKEWRKEVVTRCEQKCQELQGKIDDLENRSFREVGK